MDSDILRDLHQVIYQVNEEVKSTVPANCKAELESIVSDLLKVETRLSVYQRLTQNRKG